MHRPQSFFDERVDVDGRDWILPLVSVVFDGVVHSLGEKSFEQIPSENASEPPTATATTVSLVVPVLVLLPLIVIVVPARLGLLRFEDGVGEKVRILLGSGAG